MIRRILLAVTISAGMAIASTTPKQYTIEQLMDTVSMMGAGFSPDEHDLLVSSDKSGIYNVYTIPVSGGEQRQITSAKDSTFGDGWLPNNRIVIHRDQGGNELNHIYVRNSDGSETDLTPGDKAKADFFGWNPDHTVFYYVTNARDQRYFDVYEVPIATLKPALLYKNDGYFPQSVSADGRYVALTKVVTIDNTDVYLYDRTTGQAKNITPHTGDVASSAQSFDPKGKFLYFTTDQGGEFAYLARYELATGKVEPVQKEKWDIMYCTFSKTGRYRAVGINQDARTVVHIYDESTGKELKVPNLPQGEINGVTFSPSEKLIAFYLSSDRSPADLYVFDIAAHKVKRLTNNLSKSVDENDLVEAEVIRYKSFDGLDIPALLYKPHQVTAKDKAPALVEVHGGPGGQSRIGYRAQIQYLVNHGYVVLRVNNRGSGGYGKTFHAADDKKHGHEPLWDCVEAKKYLNGLGYVAPGKIAITGGSYGGYMVLAALTLKPTEFTAGVDFFGISNWIRTLESIPPYWEAQRDALYRKIGDPKADRDMLMEVSPLFHADKIVRPLMVLQGANDPRVIKPESDEIVAAVRKNGGVAEYVVFPDEGHGFQKKANRIKAYSAMLEFLDKYVKNAPSKG